MSEQPIRLLVMRLADMERVHPEQVPAHCHRCGHLVGVYPSGQNVLRQHPDAEIVCSVCAPPSAMGAPPAAPWDQIREEIRQSRRRS